MTIHTETLREWVNLKTFETRGGIPFAKKMWRDGYNKGINDLLTFLLMYSEEAGDGSVTTG